MLLTVALFLVVVSQVHGHTYHLGDCPTVTPMPGFDMKRFLGKWYVIQKTATGSTCLVNFYTPDENNPGHFKIEQVSENLLGLANADKKYHYTGDLVAPDHENPASMKVQFPLNVAGGASYTVFTTDYDTYAGIFTCQKLAFAHRRSTTIISRTKTLDSEQVHKIREKLASFGIDPYDLSIIKQGNCTEPQDPSTRKEADEKTFSVENVAEIILRRLLRLYLNRVKKTDDTADEKTFDIENFIGIFRKAGDKIGEGFETVAEQAKKVYTDYTKQSQTDGKEETDHVRRNMKEDAEWLP